MFAAAFNDDDVDLILLLILLVAVVVAVAVDAVDGFIFELKFTSFSSLFYLFHTHGHLNQQRETDFCLSGLFTL